MDQPIKKNVFHVLIYFEIIIVYIMTWTWEREFVFDSGPMLLATNVWPDRAPLFFPSRPSYGIADPWHESKKIMEISEAFIIPRSLQLAFILLCTYRR